MDKLCVESDSNRRLLNRIRLHSVSSPLPPCFFLCVCLSWETFMHFWWAHINTVRRVNGGICCLQISVVLCMFYMSSCGVWLFVHVPIVFNLNGVATCSIALPWNVHFFYRRRMIFCFEFNPLILSINFAASTVACSVFNHNFTVYMKLVQFSLCYVALQFKMRRYVIFLS